MNLLWFLPLVSFLVLETFALLNKHDKFEPATYSIRKLLMLPRWKQPLYWIGTGFWFWLFAHFFVDS